MGTPVSGALKKTRKQPSGADLARAHSPFGVLGVLRDLMLGGRHSRRTVARGFQVSLPTADRWLGELAIVPGVRAVRVSKTTWVEWQATSAMVRSVLGKAERKPKS